MATPVVVQLDGVKLGAVLTSMTVSVIPVRMERAALLVQSIFMAALITTAT